MWARQAIWKRRQRLGVTGENVSRIGREWREGEREREEEEIAYRKVRERRGKVSEVKERERGKSHT